MPVDGSTRTLRWPIDFAENSVSDYRWFRLVLNSDGGTVIVSNPRFERAASSEKAPGVMMDKVIYPNNAFNVYPSGSALASGYSDGLGSGLKVDFGTHGSTVMFTFDEKKTFKNYSHVKVSYWPGTCQNTAVYFDSYKKGKVSLSGGYADGMFISKKIPLSSVMDTEIAPEHVYSASRMMLQSTKSAEMCVVRSVMLE